MTSTAIILVLLYLPFCGALNANQTFNINCTQDAQCSSIRHTTCQEVVISDTTVGVLLDKRCACDGSIGFHRVDDSCKMNVAVGDMCSPEDSVCVDANSECIISPGLRPIRRCLCNAGYKQVRDGGSGTFMCGLLLSRETDPECAPCQENTGSCYDTNGDNRRDGCHCPISLTGENCQTVHAFVTCQMDGFYMNICYEAHPGIDTSSPEFSLYPEGHQMSVNCRGRTATEADCPHGGTFVLKLPLDESLRTGCGTSRIEINGALKYDNTIIADPGGIQAPIVFMTYCNFRTTVTTSGLSGLEILSSSVASAGQVNMPEMEFLIKDQLLEEYRPGAALRLGDKLKYEIHLNNEGHYAGLRVERCQFSSSGITEDPKATVLFFTLESCPAPDQTLMDASNRWRHMDGQPNHATTGYIPTIALGRGRSMYVHCVIKICTNRDLPDCSPIPCEGDAPGVPTGYGRRKRSADPAEGIDYVHIRKEITLYEDGGNSEFLVSEESVVDHDGYILIERGTFIAICIIVLVVFILLMIACIMLLRKYVCVHEKTGMQSTLVPASVPTVSQQHFFEPRLRNSRI